MAIEAMSHVRLVGLKSDKNKIMGVLTRCGQFELMHSGAYTGTARENDATHLDKTVNKRVKVAFAVDFLYAAAQEAGQLLKSNASAVKRGTAEPIRLEFTPPKKPASTRTVIAYDDFNDVAAKEYELLAICEELEKLSFRRVDIRAEQNRETGHIRGYEPYAGCPLKFTVTGTATTAILLAYATSRAAVFEPHADAYVERFTGAANCIAVITDKANETAVRTQLAADGFTVSRFDNDCTATEAIEACKQRLSVLEKDTIEVLQTTLTYLKYLGELKVLYDCLSLEIEKSEAEFALAKTSSAFVIEGWIPKRSVDSIVKAIEAETQCVVSYVNDPTPDEKPPTQVANPKIVKPFESVTNLYSPPAYTEFDPNPIMAIFFFIFFGFMVADAGYGLLISLVALIVLRRKRFEQGTFRLIALIGICGISTIVWGAVMGGVFGIEGIPALWFNPLEQPITMLAVAIVMGVVQLLVGYGLHLYKCFQQKKYIGGILDVLFIYTLFIGVGILVLGMMILDNDAVQSAGLYTVIGSVGGLMLAGAYGKKGIGGKLGGAFAGLYNIVNIMSDVLSYIRLFGLGLASGAIALAFNTLGGLLFNIPIVGYPIGAVVLVLLHAFNLGLSLLSAYVHNARLQFIEFYGKFYEGGGRLFRPMGMRTKYITFG